MFAQGVWFVNLLERSLLPMYRMSPHCPGEHAICRSPRSIPETHHEVSHRLTHLNDMQELRPVSMEETGRPLQDDVIKEGMSITIQDRAEGTWHVVRLPDWDRRKYHSAANLGNCVAETFPLAKQLRRGQ